MSKGPQDGITLKIIVNFTLVCYFLRNKWLEFDTISFQGKV